MYWLTKFLTNSCPLPGYLMLLPCVFFTTCSYPQSNTDTHLYFLVHFWFTSSSCKRTKEHAYTQTNGKPLPRSHYEYPPLIFTKLSHAQGILKRGGREVRYRFPHHWFALLRILLFCVVGPWFIHSLVLSVQVDLMSLSVRLMAMSFNVVVWSRSYLRSPLCHRHTELFFFFLVSWIQYEYTIGPWTHSFPCLEHP